MEVWLSNGTTDKIQLPVNPATLGYTYTSNNQDINIASGDQKTVISGRNQKSYEIVSVFMALPHYWTTVSNPQGAMWYVAKITSWMDGQKVLQFQVTGTNINEQVTIRSFQWAINNFNDIDYTLDLTSYKPITLLANPPSSTGSSTISTSSTSGKRPPSTKTTPTTYIVKPGQSLWLIAQEVYKDGSKDINIYNANKAVIGSNMNLIRAGMKLVIP